MVADVLVAWIAVVAAVVLPKMWPEKHTITLHCTFINYYYFHWTSIFNAAHWARNVLNSIIFLFRLHRPFEPADGIIISWGIVMENQKGHTKKWCTVEPRLTNTLLGRTPLLNEQLWSVPNIFSVIYTKIRYKTSRKVSKFSTCCPPKMVISWA